MLQQFESAEGWRKDAIPRLRDQLDHHWAEVVADCVQVDDPLAYGIDKLRHARRTVAADLRGLDAAVPVDLTKEREEVVEQPHKGRLGRPVSNSPQREELATALARLDEALNRTRAERVHGLSQDPPAYLEGTLGPLPATPAGRAVWSHHALGVEAALDRGENARALRGNARLLSEVRLQIWAADRVLQGEPEELGPGGWARAANDASRAVEELRALAGSRPAVHPSRWGVGVRQTTSVEQPHTGPTVEL